MGYFLAARLALSLATTAPGVAPIWPSTGIGIAATVLWGRRMLPAIFIGSFAAVISTGDGVGATLITAAGDVAEAWIAITLLRRVDFDPSMRRINDAVAYVAFAGIFATAVSALFGMVSVWSTGVTGVDRLANMWRDWWLGDLTGAIIVGSLILVVSQTTERELRSWRALHVGVAAVAVGAVSYPILDGHGSLPYLVLPLLYALAFMYRQRGAVIGAFLIGTIVVVLTCHHLGPFLGGGLVEALTRAETFIAVGGVTGLMVAAALSERVAADDARGRLEESEHALQDAQHLASVGSFEIDLRTNETSWSDEVLNICGLAREQMGGSWMAWRDTVVTEDLAKLDSFTGRLYNASEEGSIVHRIVRADGQIRWVELRLKYLADPDDGSSKRPVRVLGTCHDVTGEVVAEQQAQALFQHAPYAIVVVDAGGTIVRSNVPAQELFGVGPGGLEGGPIDAVLHSPGGSVAHWYLSGSEDGTRPDLELWGHRGDGGEFPVEVSLGRLPTVAGDNTLIAVRDVTRLREETATLNFAARHDSLTGLPNRLMFLEHMDLALARARRSRRPVAVVFADLDDFKIVNDTRGHDIGDRLLVELAARLEEAIREGDMVARLGGDEFVVLCEDVADQAAAVDVAQRLVDCANVSFRLGDQDHHVALSAGLVMVTDAEQVTTGAVLRDADAAMYAAKAQGKGRVAIFSPELTRTDALRTMLDKALESALRGVIERDELLLHMQPIFDLSELRLRAFEVYVRWRHSSRGLLSPAEFLPLAERSGHLTEIGRWVLMQTCRQLATWGDEFDGHTVRAAVNVSVHELIQPDYVASIRDALDETGIDPRWLVIEISETALLRDLAAVEQQLQQVCDLGVHISIDDFGLGRSSVSTLRALRLSGLKLHGSFVRALNGTTPDYSGLDAALSVASSLGVPVVAEQVETWAAAVRLRQAGCAMGQGYLFGQPEAPEQLTALIAADRERDHEREPQDGGRLAEDRVSESLAEDRVSESLAEDRVPESRHEDRVPEGEADPV